MPLRKKVLVLNKEIEWVPVANLRLDALNPRLPEETRPGASQAELLAMLYRDFSLGELAQSYLANGFFPSEQLIALKESSIVVEGNRRLAALKYLLHDQDAVEAGIPPFDTDEDFTEEQRASLQRVPVLFVDSRDDLWAYLGYRHIGGAKEWSPAAKARFVVARVDEVAKTDPDGAFKAIGRQVGGNATSVRRLYIQYLLLKTARDDLGLYEEAAYVLRERFGVWQRLVNSSNLFEYIGFKPTDKSRPAPIVEAAREIDADKFSLLLKDLVPRSGAPALLSDSRRASDYTTILANEEAISLLRETRDFEAARAVANGLRVNERLERIYSDLQTVQSTIESGTETDGDTVKSLRRIAARVAAIQSVLAALSEDGEI